jgi:hypothetical protein
MAFGRRKNESSSSDAREAAARLPKTMPARDPKQAVPENPHSNQYSGITAGYTNREEKPVPGSGQRSRGEWLRKSR